MKKRDIILLPGRSCKIIGFSCISGHISHHASHQKGYGPNYGLWRAKQDETRMNGGEDGMETNICQAIMCRTWINTNVYAPVSKDRFDCQGNTQRSSKHSAAISNVLE